MSFPPWFNAEAMGIGPKEMTVASILGIKKKQHHSRAGTLPFSILHPSACHLKIFSTFVASNFIIII